MNSITYPLLKYLVISLAGLLIIPSLNAATVINLRGQSPALISNFQQESIATSSNFRLVQEQTDKKGVVHKQYVQYFQGIPLWGQHIVTHEKNGTINSINGVLVDKLSSDISTTKATFSEIEAIERAKLLVQQQNTVIKPQDYKKAKAKLFIYVDASQQANLVYHVDLLARTESINLVVTRPQFIMDALTGAILKQWEGLTDNKIGTGPGGNIRMTGGGIMPIAPYEYGVDFDFLDVEEIGDGNCRLATPDVMSIDYKDGTNNDAYIYPCPRNTYKEVNGAYAPLNDVHFAGQKVFDMYRAWYGEAPLPPDFTWPLRMYAHLPDANAYWDGSAVLFGDGDSSFHPFVSIDIVSHEIAHGFTEYHANLVYEGQSGGINESFSDMAGEAAEFYILGENDWYAAAYIAKNGDPLRYMCEPTLDGVSIDNVADYYDGMDVHESSGVFNKAFCLLAQKPNWNTQKAFEVMLRANGYGYWWPQSNFFDAACGAVMAAGSMGYETVDVCNAFLQVGADPVTGGCPLIEGCSTGNLPPPNDDFDQATQIAPLPFSDSLSTSMATDAPDDPHDCTSAAGKTVWYSLTAPANMTLEINTFGSDFDTVLAAYVGTRGQLTQIGCNDDTSNTQSQLFLDVSAGQTVFFMVGGYGGSFGNLIFTVTSPPPANDDFDQATEIAPLPFSDSLSTFAATDAPDDPSASCAPRGKTVWYSLTAPANMTIEVNTFGSDFDTVVAAYVGTRGQLTQIGCNDDASGGQSQLFLDVSAGQTVFFMVGGYGGSFGNLIFTVVSSTSPGGPCDSPVPPATYSNTTREAIIPCLEMQLYTDIDGKPLILDPTLKGLYRAVLEIPFGFSDIEVKELTWIEDLTISNPDTAKFDSETGILSIPTIEVPTITYITGETASGPVVNCHAVLRQSVLRPKVLSLTEFNCSLP